METIITYLIYLHAALGGIGLLSGLLSILSRKGQTRHINSGRLFSYSMGGSSLLSLVIAQMPGHHNTFLFLIGIFTIYLVLAGNRALTLRKHIKTQADWIDKGISLAMMLASFIMIGLGGYGLIQKTPFSSLYLFFGSLGIFMTLRDFQTFRSFTENKNAWLTSHLGRMTGALIASTTAFLVAGLNINATLVWITPTLLGTTYIIFHIRKYQNPQKNV